MKLKLCSLFILIYISGCTIMTGQDVTQSVIVSEAEALNILSDYMRKNDIAWGQPTLIKVAPPKYVFKFFTPEKELPKLGARIIVVDMNTGEVSVPMRL